MQLTGGSSLSVTLPKSWVERAQIQAGDLVGCAPRADGTLSIHPHTRGEREVQRYVVEIGDEQGEYVFRKVIAAYLMGYDVISVTSKKPLQPGARTALRQAVRRIIGLEIVEEEPNTISVQDFLDPKEFHMDKALRRMSMLTQAMQEEAVSTFTGPQPDVADSLRDRDDEVDRLYWLVNKQFHAMLRDVGYASKMGLTASQALNFLLVARLVERTADHADRMATQALLVPRTKQGAAFLARLEKEARRAFELFRESLQTFHKQDAKKANALVDAVARFQQGHEGLLREAAALGGEPVSHLAIILESINRTAAYAADIGEVSINHKVASA